MSSVFVEIEIPVMLRVRLSQPWSGEEKASVLEANGRRDAVAAAEKILRQVAQGKGPERLAPFTFKIQEPGTLVMRFPPKGSK